MPEFYLDNAATAPICREALDAYVEAEQTAFGNASSFHQAGVMAAKLVETARCQIAAAINADPDEIYFTSGGTESNNWVLKGVAAAREFRGNIVVSAIEHPSILNAAMSLKDLGMETRIAPVDGEGFIRMRELEQAIDGDTVLVSIMHANNEIGTIQDIDGIGALCSAKGVPLHTDACQSFLKTTLDARKSGASFATINAHKVHGPKGVGALYARKNSAIKPLLDGGKQERRMRAGTYNTPAIAGFGAAVKAHAKDDATRISAIRDRFIARMLSIPSVKLNGPEDKRLCTNINITARGAQSKDLLHALSARGVYVSEGSACASGKTEPSYVLTAIGLAPEEAKQTIRISLSRYTAPEQAEAAAAIIAEEIAIIRKQ